MISDKALSKMLVVYTEQCGAVASFTKRTVIAIDQIVHTCTVVKVMRMQLSAADLEEGLASFRYLTNSTL